MVGVFGRFLSKLRDARAFSIAYGVGPITSETNEAAINFAIAHGIGGAAPNVRQTLGVPIDKDASGLTPAVV